MAIAKIEQVETKTELQADVERLQRLAGLVSNASRDLHQQIQICVNKHGAETVANTIGCTVDDLQTMCDSCITTVKKGTGEMLPTIEIKSVTISKE